MIELHLNSNSVLGVIRLHEQNLFHQFQIIDVLLYVSRLYTKYNLDVVIELVGPHNLKCSWFLACKKLSKSVGRICKMNRRKEDSKTFIMLIGS